MRERRLRTHDPRPPWVDAQRRQLTAA